MTNANPKHKRYNKFISCIIIYIYIIMKPSKRNKTKRNKTKRNKNKRIGGIFGFNPLFRLGRLGRLGRPGKQVKHENAAENSAENAAENAAEAEAEAEAENKKWNTDEIYNLFKLASNQWYRETIFRKKTRQTYGLITLLHQPPLQIHFNLLISAGNSKN